MRVVGVVIALVLWPIVAFVVIWAASVLFMLHEAVVAALESDRSVWYYAGRASVYAKVVVRHPRTVIAVVAAAPIAKGVSETIGDVVSVINSKSDQNPPPEVSPIQEANLRMPTEYPFKRLRNVAPPFIGHNFPLGGEQP